MGFLKSVWGWGKWAFWTIVKTFFIMFFGSLLLFGMANLLYSAAINIATFSISLSPFVIDISQWQPLLWLMAIGWTTITAMWVYLRFKSPEGFLMNVLRWANWIFVVLAMVAVIFVMFVGPLLATGEVMEEGKSFAQTILKWEFWQATWLNAEWRNEHVWNNAAWSELVFKTLDYQWWINDVVPWINREAENSVTWLDGVTGASIIAGVIMPIFWGLVAMGGSARVVLGILLKAAGAGIFQKIAFTLVSRLRGRHTHVPDKDVGIQAKIAVFQSFRSEGGARAKLAVRLLKSCEELFTAIDLIPDVEKRDMARAYALQHLAGADKRLRKAVTKRTVVLRELTLMIEEFDAKVADLEDQIEELEAQKKAIKGGFLGLKKRPVKKQLKALKKELKDVSAEYDGKVVWANALSRKKPVNVPGKFQELYPAYSAHEKRYTLPLVANMWGLLEDMEADMYSEFGIWVDTLEDMKRIGMLTYLKDLVSLAREDRQEQKKQTKLLMELVKNSAPSKLPVKAMQQHR